MIVYVVMLSKDIIGKYSTQLQEGGFRCPKS